MSDSVQVLFNFHIYDRKITYNKEVISLKGSSFKYDRINNLNGTKNYKGEISKSGRKMIEKRLTAWLHCLRFHNQNHPEIPKRKRRLPTFVTLTLSDDTTRSDREIKKSLLEPFIKQLYYAYNITHYFWKAEKQKNGRLHFHLITDRYIPMKDLQTRWNSIQRKNGLTESYEEKYNKPEPPSTHIRAIQQQDNQIEYVMKYVEKGNKGLKLDGSVFRFSKGLLDIVPFSFIFEAHDTDELRRKIEIHCQKEFHGDWFGMLEMDKKNIMSWIPARLYRDVEKYYLNLYDRLYNTKVSKPNQLNQLKQTEIDEQTKKQAPQLIFDF